MQNYIIVTHFNHLSSTCQGLENRKPLTVWFLCKWMCCMANNSLYFWTRSQSHRDAEYVRLFWCNESTKWQGEKSSGPSADIHILGDMQLILLVWDLLQLGQQSVSVTWAWTFTSCPSPASQVSWGELPNVSENQLPFCETETKLWRRSVVSSKWEYVPVYHL